MTNPIKDEFPILKNNPELVYLDNSATTQKPQLVLDAELDFYKTHNSNVHRGLYPLSESATQDYEAARKIIASFINAQPEEIIFTSGTTDSINAAALSIRNTNLFKNPKILLTELEHHSNLIPWQKLSENIKYIPLTADYQLDLSSEKELVDFNPNIIAVTLASNVTGTVTNIKALRDLFPKALLVVDAAQAVAHFQVDVKKLGVDLLSFSGHKMYGPTGVGVLYGKKPLLEKLEPFRYGGGMIREVTKEKATWAELPEKFEAGTPPIAQAVALAKASEYIIAKGFDWIIKHESHLKNYLLEALSKIEDIHIYHSKDEKSIAVVSFSVEKVHPHDLAQFLGDHGVCVRAGHHCTQVLHKDVLKIGASLRVSIGIYNSKEDIDKFIETLKDGIKYFTVQ